MGVERPTYGELEARLAQAEKVSNAVRSGNIDAIIAEGGVYLIRLKEMEEALRKSKEELRIRVEALEQAQKELRAARDELELRVKERTFELESANKRLEAEIAERKKIGERLRHLSARLMEAQETERRNVALDLHDGLGGHLMAIKMALESKLDDVKKGQPASESITMKEIKGLVKDCIRELGRIQHNLRPSVLDNLGIGPALRSLCREFQNQQKNIETSWKIEIDESYLSEELKTVIYRITQEAFTNAAKHSGAENMSLSLTHGQGNIQLKIKDDGCGFDTEKALSPDKVRQGIGLSSMEERCELLGGSFSIHSQEGKGTTIHASWPFG